MLGIHSVLVTKPQNCYFFPNFSAPKKRTVADSDEPSDEPRPSKKLS